MSAVKTNPGNFFEDFKLGQEIRHAVPRTLVKPSTWPLVCASSVGDGSKKLSP